MSGQEGTNQKKEFQKVDRRRFDSDGNERGQTVKSIPINGSAETSLSDSSSAQRMDRAESVPDPAAAVASGNPSQDGDLSEEIENGQPASDVAFTSFIMSLATQTMVQLGEMQPPPGMDIPLDVESAKESIETIAMLQVKTKGNLSADESRFLVDVLHTLRTSYVRRAK